MLRKLFVTALILAGGLFADHQIAVGDSVGQSPSGEPVAERPPRVQFGTFLVQAVGARVKMVWQISGDGSVSGFRIYRREITDSEEIVVTGNSSLDASARTFEEGGLRPGATYQYRVAATMPDGEEVRSQVSTVKMPAAPFTLTIGTSDPNSESTRIEYSVPVAGPATIEVYDAHGNLVNTLVRVPVRAGDNAVTWDRKDHGGATVSAGTYFCRLSTSCCMLTRKFVLIR